MPSGRLLVCFSSARVWLLAALATLVLVACAGDGSGPGPNGDEASPVSEPPASPMPGSLDDFRAFAQQIEEALAQQDADFFLDRLLLAEDICSGREQIGPCVGHEPGRLAGVPTSTWRFLNITFISEEEYPQQLRSYLGAARADLSDKVGDGALRLYAVTRDREDVFGAITISIVDVDPDGQPKPEPAREAHLFKFAFMEGEWRLVGQTVALALLTAADFLEGGACAAPDVADYCLYHFWERWEGAP